jgi:PDZ domain
MKQSAPIGKMFVCVVVLTASCHASALAQNLTGRRPDEKGQGIGKIPDPQDPVKVKIEAVGGQQLWRGDIMQIPILPAPEVVRMWSEEVLANVRISAKVLSLVADLDSHEFAQRQAASARLSDPTVTTEEVFAILVRGNLSDEQRERLLTVAREKVLALPRGALGIRMQVSGNPEKPGVEVQMLLPDMPAASVLKIGDRIESIDGKPVKTSNDLVDIIQSKVPGDSVKMSVARQQRDEREKPKLDGKGGFVEEHVEVQVDLTSATNLDKFEGQFPTSSRSMVLERRLLALREAEEKFAPATAKVPSIPTAVAKPVKKKTVGKQEADMSDKAP